MCNRRNVALSAFGLSYNTTMVSVTLWTHRLHMLCPPYCAARSAQHWTDVP